MNIIRTNRFSTYAFLLISISLIFFNYNSIPGNILSWDVFGYYLYLPLTFIYDNTGLQNLEIVNNLKEQYNSSSTLYQIYETTTGSWVIRYPMGLSFLYFPFFMIGHLFAVLIKYPADGFSYPYQIAIFSGSILYSIMGFYFLKKALINYFSDTITAVTILIIYFGTNYFFHSSFHGTNAMSHNYLFTLYGVLIWSTIKWHSNFNLKYAVIVGFACGLIIISRQSELICFIIPVFWGIGSKYTIKEKIKLFLNHRWHVILITFILLFLTMPQVIYWKILTGKFLHLGYGNNPGEGFEFLTPFIKEVLFSFRKGWLIYTPIMFFSLIGLIFAVKNKSSFGITILIYFIFNLYIVSSWSNWWYAESFSQRALIPSYAVLALPLGVTFDFISKRQNKLVIIPTSVLICSLIFLNSFQTWQFLNGLIHPSRMTKAAYFTVFGKTKISENFKKLLLIDRDSEQANDIDENQYIKTKKWILDFENIPGATDEVVYSGNFSMKMSNKDSYSPNITKAYKDITDNDHAKLKISAYVYLTTETQNNPGSLVISFEHNGYSYSYKSADLENLKIELNKWTQISTTYLTPVIRNKSDVLKVYYWHRGEKSTFIDNLEVEVWEAISK